MTWWPRWLRKSWRIVGTESPAIQEWHQNRIRLRELVATEDPRGFIKWDVIQKSMFVRSAPYIAEELRVLRSSGQWRTRWKQALQEDVDRSS